MFNVAATITSALLAAAIAADSPGISALAAIVVCAMWIDENKLNNAMDKIGAYIRVVLTPALPGLLWEQVHQKAMESRTSSSMARRIASVVIYRYPVMAIVAYVVTGILCLDKSHTLVELTVVTSLGLISLILFLPSPVPNRVHVRRKGVALRGAAPQSPASRRARYSEAISGCRASVLIVRP